MKHSLMIMDFRASFDDEPFIGPYTEYIGDAVVETAKGDELDINIFVTEEIKSLLDGKTYELRLFDGMIDETIPIVVELDISEDEFLLLKLSWPE